MPDAGGAAAGHDSAATGDGGAIDDPHARAAAGRQGRWFLTYEGFEPAQEGLREALCTTGNGYFATRGAAPEARADAVHYPGTYVSGLFNRLASEIAGRTVENESIVNLPNWLALTFRFDGGPWFDPGAVELLQYSQELDLRRGVLTRRVRLRDSAGRRTRLTQRRFVSMADPHLGALEVTICAENWSGSLEVRSALDGTVENSGVGRYRQLAGRHLEAPELGELDADTVALKTRTVQSQVVVAMAARTLISTKGDRIDSRRRVVRTDREIGQEIALELRAGEAVSIEKTASIYTSRDPAISEPGMEAHRALQRAGSFRELLDAHVVRMDHLWERLHVQIEDDDPTGQILNLNIFHLLQTVSENTVDLDVGVPPRGLHGEAYRGHIFWDELFVFPYLTLTLPELTRSLLRYRHRRLPEARRAAREAGYAGAMFPWQSGSDGREETPTVHLNPRSGRWLADHSHRQRHINSAIAYNLWQYHQASSDVEFTAFYGAEVLLEIARFWASIAVYDRSRDRYVIRGVMGPDEYHDGYPWSDDPGIDNNAYTNIMAAWVLCRAIDLLGQLPSQRRTALSEQLQLSRTELDRFDDISRRMLVPFHGEAIISQFEGYERLQELDWERYRRRYGDIQRLDRILEAEADSPNRYKASKQADVLMLFFLLSAEELEALITRLGYPWDSELIPRNIDYYAARTSHGSTLSRVVHSWVLARANRPGSWQRFNEVLRSDIDDIQGGTTAEGIHLGAMAGSIDLLTRGYTGLEPRGEVLWLNPSLPRELARLSFSIRYRHHRDVRIEIAEGRVRLTIPPSEAAPITIGYEGTLTEIGPGERFDAPLPRRAFGSDGRRGA